MSDRAVKVLWSPPKQANGVLTGYKIKYKIKDMPKTLKEEVFPPNVTSVKIGNLQVYFL